MEALQSLRLREKVTPATETYLAMAVVQGATGKDLAEPTSQLKLPMATLETGIKEVGPLNLEDRIPHDVRQQIYTMSTVSGHP